MKKPLIGQTRTNADLNDIANYLEKYSFLEDQGINGKFLNELGEKVTYQIFEADDEIISYGKTHDNMYLILDGRIDFNYDLLDSKVRERHIKEMARDLQIDYRKLTKDIDNYKLENGLKDINILQNQYKKELSNKLGALMKKAQKKLMLKMTVGPSAANSGLGLI